MRVRRGRYGRGLPYPQGYGSLEIAMKLLKFITLLSLFSINACHSPRLGVSSAIKPKVGDKLVTLIPIYVAPKQEVTRWGTKPRTRSAAASSSSNPGYDYTQIPAGAEILVTEYFYLPGEFMVKSPSFIINGKFAGKQFPGIKEPLGITGLYQTGAFELVSKFPSEKTADEIQRDKAAKARRVEMPQPAPEIQPGWQLRPPAVSPYPGVPVE